MCSTQYSVIGPSAAVDSGQPTPQYQCTEKLPSPSSVSCDDHAPHARSMAARSASAACMQSKALPRLSGSSVPSACWHASHRPVWSLTLQGAQLPEGSHVIR